MAKQAYRAKTSFAAATKPGVYPDSFAEGEVVMSDDSRFKALHKNAREQMFDQIGEVEQATAAPGEKRKVPQRARKQTKQSKGAKAAAKTKAENAAKAKAENVDKPSVAAPEYPSEKAEILLPGYLPVKEK